MYHAKVTGIIFSWHWWWNIDNRCVCLEVVLRGPFM